MTFDFVRFSSFMQGDSHLSDSEMMDYGEETEDENDEVEQDVELFDEEDEIPASAPGSSRTRSVANGNGHHHLSNAVYTDDDSD